MPTHANHVNWFEIPVNDMSQAKKFYEAAFEVEITESEMGPKLMGFFPMEMERMGSAGCLVKSEGYKPSHEGTVVYIHVDKIDETLEAISKAGGKTLMPRMSIGEHGFIAHFEDCEGNRVALHEYPEA